MALLWLLLLTPDKRATMEDCPGSPVTNRLRYDYICGYAIIHTYPLFLTHSFTCTHMHQKMKAHGPRDIALGDTPKPYTHTHRTHTVSATFLIHAVSTFARSFLSNSALFSLLKKMRLRLGSNPYLPRRSPERCPLGHYVNFNNLPHILVLSQCVPLVCP